MRLKRRGKIGFWELKTAEGFRRKIIEVIKDIGLTENEIRGTIRIVIDGNIKEKDVRKVISEIKNYLKINN